MKNIITYPLLIALFSLIIAEEQATITPAQASKYIGKYKVKVKILEKDPSNIENNKKLSDMYFAEKNYDDAFAVIFNLYIKSKKENKDKVKKILLNYFDLLGSTHQKTKDARRRLSSIIFS